MDKSKPAKTLNIVVLKVAITEPFYDNNEPEKSNIFIDACHFEKIHRV
jgi:hypothetical protein